jgi:phenylacetate-CoA ligase
MLDRQQLSAWQSHRLRQMLHELLAHNRFYRQKLARLFPRPDDVPADPLPLLAEFPFTTKEELLADQQAHPPYGTNLTYPRERYVRVHQTSGTATGQPLRWLDTRESWDWFLHCWDLIYDMAGLRADDRVFFPFSFGPFIGFWAAFEAAARRGMMVLPGGGMTSLARLHFLRDNAATVVCCTPTYALRLAEVAQQAGLDLAGSTVRCLIVAGEPGGSVPATRQRIEQAWGARVFDHAGMTEIGSFGMECPEQPGGLHVLETEFLAEVVDVSGQAVAPGQPGELVLTNLGRWGSPLIRYRTGDRVVLDAQDCPCGRPWKRLHGGILGRMDDMLVIRGNNIYPSAIENIVRRFAAIQEFQIEVWTTASLTQVRLMVEAAESDPDRLREELEQSVRAELLFRPEVRVVPPGTLPRSEMKSRRLVRKLAADVSPSSDSSRAY